MCLVKTEFRGWVQLGEGKVCSNSNALEGVYRPSDIEVVRRQLSSRSDRFIFALEDDQYGGSFRGRDFNEPLNGAFGEKL